jgi:hypothetical protein
VNKNMSLVFRQGWLVLEEQLGTGVTLRPNGELKLSEVGETDFSEYFSPKLAAMGTGMYMPFPDHPEGIYPQANIGFMPGNLAEKLQMTLEKR